MIYEFGEFTLDTENKTLTQNGKQLKIEPKPLMLLSFLVMNQKRFFNDDALIKALWKDDGIESSNITTHIYNIRKILGEDAKKPKYIPKDNRGYWFEAPDLIVTTNKETALSYSLIISIAHFFEKIDSRSYTPSTSNKFNRWLTKETSYLKYAIIVLGLTILGALFLMFVIHSSYTMSWISGIQFLILFLLYVKASPFLEGIEQKIENPDFWDNKLNEKERMATGCKSFEEFKRLSGAAKDMMEYYYEKWRALLGIWAVLYLSFIVIGLLPKLGDLKIPGGDFVQDTDVLILKGIIFSNVINTLLNNIATYAILNCFKILSSPIKQGDNYKPLSANNHAWIILIIGIFTVVEFGILTGLINYKYDIGTIEQAMIVIDGLSGIAAATVMAMWFARLQSKILNPPQWFVILLFSYTAIQPFFVIINVGKLGVWIIVAALLFKLLLILYTTYLFQTGRLFFYFLRVRKNYLYIEDEFHDFSNKFVNKETAEAENQKSHS